MSDMDGTKEPLSTQEAGEPGAEESASREGEANAEARPTPEDEAKRYKDLWMRAAADFDNFRKRTRRELEDAKKSGAEDLLRAMLPVFDNLERALQSAQKATDVKPVSEGLQMILRQFTDTLGRVGVVRVESVGKGFDPQVHEAIQQVETEEHPAGTVIAEVQPGYRQGERLVRAAMVVVAKAKPESADPKPAN